MLRQFQPWHSPKLIFLLAEQPLFRTYHNFRSFEISFEMLDEIIRVYISTLSGLPCGIMIAKLHSPTIMLRPRALWRRLFTSHDQIHAAGLSKRQLFWQSTNRFQSIQAAIAPQPSLVTEADFNHLDDVFALLQTKQIAWNSQEQAKFDFRSRSLFIFDTSSTTYP
jgi:hypothetical protein